MRLQKLLKYVRKYSVVYIGGCFLGAAALLFSDMALAKGNGIPVDPAGDTLPAPTGNIPYFKMPDVLVADKGEYTWDYSGTLQNSSQNFSFQSTLVQLTRQGKSGFGFHTFDFGFQDNGSYYFSNSAFGGDNQIDQAVTQSMDLVQSSASLQQLSISLTSLTNPINQWTVKSIGQTPQPPLYKGWVGQPGHEYQLTGTGSTFLWRFDAATGKYTVAPYTYNVSITFTDQMGATMEGLASGYVGPALIPATAAGVKVESEVAQPRLQVSSWSVTYQTLGTVNPGYQASYAFSGNSGILWNDFGPVDESGGSSQQALSTKMVSIIQHALRSYGDTVDLSRSQIRQLSGPHHGLYNGNWLPINFTSGKYAGASLVFFTFWNKATPNPTNQTTSDISWSQAGWVNFFAGDIPGQVDSSASMDETLYPENPALPSSNTTEVPPYQVTLDKFVPAQYQSAFPWAQKVTLTINANTPLRYALASYADELAHSTTADDPTQNLVITLKAISPITQNTLFSDQLTQYYEGAAIPTINKQVVGYSWIEHMVNSTH